MTQLFMLEFPLPSYKVTISYTSKPYFQFFVSAHSPEFFLHISIPRHS